MNSTFAFLFNELEKIRTKLDLPDFANHQSEIERLISGKNKSGLQEVFTKLSSKYKELDKQAIDDYLAFVSFEHVKESEEKTHSRGLLAGIYSSFIAEDSKGYVILHHNHNALEVQRLSREIYEYGKQHGIGFAQKHIIPFIISEDTALKGMLSAKIYNTKQTMQIGEIINYKGEEQLIMNGYGVGRRIKGAKQVKNSVLDYYLFTFKGEDEKDYIVLSQEDIKPQACIVHGLTVYLNDSLVLGEKTMVPTSTRIIYATKIESDIPHVSKEEYDEIKKELKDYNMLSDWVFGKYKHPQWFEKFIIAQMFSYPYGGFPLHTALFGSPGTCKTPVLEILQSHFCEPAGMFTGANSTIKGLVASFHSASPSAGYLSECRRVALIDEFLGSVLRGKTKSGHGEETGLLRNLLEWKSGKARSGIRNVSINPTMRCVFTSNFEGGITDLVGLSECFHHAFLARVLWYAMTPEHVEFLMENKLKFVSDDSTWVPKSKNFLMLYEYFTKKKLNLDAIRCNKIFKDAMELIPEKMLPIARGKGLHTVLCLVDGIAKINCVSEGRKELVALEKDYVEATEIYRYILSSWSLHKSDSPPKIKQDYYKGNIRRLYNLICQSPGSSRKELRPSFDQIDQYLPKLLYDQTVINDKGFLYPFWHSAIKDRRLDGDEQQTLGLFGGDSNE